MLFFKIFLVQKCDIRYELYRQSKSDNIESSIQFMNNMIGQPFIDGFILHYILDKFRHNLVVLAWKYESDYHKCLV